MDIINNGHNAISAKKTLKSLEKKEHPSMTRSDFLNVAGYLMAQLLLVSGQRSGAVRNMTIGEFDHRIEKGEYSIITVQTHKTGYTGPATLPLDNELLQFMIIYRDKIRGDANRFPALTSTNPLFTNYNGSPLKSTAFSKIIKTGTGTDVTATIIRKSMVTEMRLKHPDKAIKLSKQMNHTTKTQELYYDLPNREIICAEMAPLMRDAIRQKPTATITRDSAQLSSTVQHTIYAGTGDPASDNLSMQNPSTEHLDPTSPQARDPSTGQQHPVSPSTQDPSTGQHHTISPQTPDHPKSTSTTPPESSLLDSPPDDLSRKRRLKFNEADENFIKKVFKSAITKEKGPLQCEAKIILSNEGERGKELLDLYGTKKITDKVRSIIRNK